MSGEVLRIGTRGSALARSQSSQVAAELARFGIRSELVLIRTEGDVSTAPLATIGGTGVFVTAVRTALLAGDVDLIVHSYKDLPTAAAPGIRLAAVPLRAAPFDALCARDQLTLAELPAGATVGTGSPRRLAQLRRRRPDVAVTAIRGNVDTRLTMVTDGSLDAVVLAQAGLGRLGYQHHISEVFGGDGFLPAPAQGALALETRDTTGDLSATVEHALTAIDHQDTRAAAAAERTLLAVLEAGCSAPVGALATVDADTLTLSAAVIAVDGSDEIAGTRSGFVLDAAEVGSLLAQDLLNRGAARLLASAR